MMLNEILLDQDKIELNKLKIAIAKFKEYDKKGKSIMQMFQQNQDN